MGKINILDKHVAELIAAGEVVERPASVIKELVENAVDAGSTAVTVEIQNGGVTFMRVTDNGCGIAREDVPAAFLRHATSKIRTGDDLNGIATLGFRGEALASVAAVSHVELLTRTEGELAGTHYGIDGDGEQLCEDAGCAVGTTILVKDLFYNTPARMKFLKKDATEGNTIAAVMDKAALSHPDIAFRFLRDGREALRTPGDGRLKSAVYAVFGKEFTAGLIPVEYELGGVQVSGFVSKPSAARPNRSMQNFFINGRSIRSRTATVALEEAFKGSLMVGKLPACVLHLLIPPDAVDVNVHPAKLEVRFVNEKPIFDSVYHGVKTALSKGDTPPVIALNRPAAPVLQPTQPTLQTAEQLRLSGAEHRPVPPAPRAEAPEQSAPRPPIRYEVRDVAASAFSKTAVSSEAEGPEESSEAPATSYWGREQSTVPVAPALAQEFPPEAVSQQAAEFSAIEPPMQPAPEEAPERFIGEAFSTYAILERGSELIFIDKHAAHERMLYERLKAGEGRAHSQMLLTPITVTLDKSEYSAVLDSLGVYAEAGFEIEDFGTGTVLVRSAPMVLAEGEVAEQVMEIAGYLASSKTDLTTEKLDWLYHNVACRAAVKAGDSSTPEELMALARRAEDEDVRYCPHGRPVSFILKRRDLEHQFGRIQ